MFNGHHVSDKPMYPWNMVSKWISLSKTNDWFPNFIVGKTEAEKTEISFGHKAKNRHWDINPKIFGIKPSVPKALLFVFCLY